MAEERQTAGRRNAQNYFTKTEKRDVALREERNKAKVADAAKMLRLRTLRLAKEEADRAAAEAARPPPPAKASAKKAAAPKVVMKRIQT